MKIRTCLILTVWLQVSQLSRCDVLDLGCDPDWYPFGDYCYKFVTTKQVTQDQAFDECDVYTSYLLRIETKDEYAFVNQTLQTFSSDGFWTQLTNLRFDGTELANPVWQWGSYGPADLSFLQWESYPNTKKSVDSCFAVDPNVKFSNWNCNRRLGYICKIDNAPGQGSSTVQPIFDVSCPGDGWFVMGQDCYYVSNASDPSQLVTWNDAITKCENLVRFSVTTNPSQLLTLTDSTDEAMLNNLMTITVKNPALFWTALKYTQNSYTWATGDPFNINYIHFVQEPDNVRNKEHCGIIKPDAKIADQNCKNTFNFICRKDTSSVDTDYYFGCHGWQRAGQKCYEFYDSPASSWSDARSKCQSVNADLVHVDNFDERRWLEWQMSGEDHMSMYWTGLNDQQTEGAYKWADGSVANTTFIRWNQEPNSWRGDEDCVNTFTDGAANDADCYVQAHAICEFIPSPGTQCPSDWIQDSVSNHCFFISTGNQTFTWSEARTFCSQTKAQQYGQNQLIAMDSKNKWAFVKKTLSTYAFVPHGWWTNLNDIKTDGVWVNGDSKTPVDPSIIPWRAQPLDPDGTKDCAGLGWGGRYFSFKCKNKLGFICVSNAHGISSANNSSRMSSHYADYFYFLLLIFVLNHVVNR